MISYDEVSRNDKFKEYLEDGVYISFDGFNIWLRTQREDGRWHEVALSPQGVELINRYAKSLEERVKNVSS